MGTYRQKKNNASHFTPEKPHCVSESLIHARKELQLTRPPQELTIHLSLPGGFEGLSSEKGVGKGEQ